MNYCFIILDSVRYDLYLQSNTENFDKIGEPKVAYTSSCITICTAAQFFGYGFLPFSPDLNGWNKYPFGKGRTGHLKKLKKEGYKIIFATTVPYLSPLDTVNPLFPFLKNYINEYIFDMNVSLLSHTIIPKVQEILKHIDKYYLILWLGETHYPYETKDMKCPKEELKMINDFNKGLIILKEEVIKKIKERQIKCIEYLDRLIGKSIFPFLDDCFVCITADHADSHGENGYFGHGIGPTHIKMFEVPIVIGKIGGKK